MGRKRLVAPDTPVRSFPTPNIDDLLVFVDVDSRLPGYKPLEYGSLHPDQNKFPGAKLVFQEPIDGADQFVRRIYATDRVNQDTYNYAIRYSGGSPDHPIYARNYLELRETYKPSDPGTVDPLNSLAILVDEEAKPVEGELSSLYFNVTRVFETLPGPWVPFTRYDDDLGPIQGRRRAVKNEGQVASLGPTSRTVYEARDGSADIFIESEENWSDGSGSELNPEFPIRNRDFYDASRGAVQESRQIIVTTGNEVGSIENIGGTITQISYEPYNEFLSVKIVQTYNVNGPQLVGNTTNNEGQLLTVKTQRKGSDGYIPPSPTATRTVEVSREDAESLVERVIDAPKVFDGKTLSASKPDVIPEQFRASVPSKTTQEIIAQESISMPSLGVNDLERTEQRITEFTVRKTEVKRDTSTFPTLRGQDYESGVNITIPFEEKITPSGLALGSDATFVDPLSEDFDLVRKIDLDSVRLELGSVFLSFPTRTSLNLPKILRSVKILWDTSFDDAKFASEWIGYASGTSGSLSGSESGRASAQASVSPSFIVDLEEVYATNIPTTSYFFFLPYPVGLNDILQRVDALPWPIFKPQSHVLSAFGQSGRVSVEGSASASSTFSKTTVSEDKTTGSGSSYARAQQTITVSIPSSIHGTITIEGSASAPEVEGTADFSIGWEGTNFPSVFVSSSAAIKVKGKAPTSIPSVSGPTDIPRSGKYLIDSRVELYQYGYAKIYAEVLDASIFA